MPKIHNQNRKADLALALARGGTVVEWARANKVGERTAYTWAREPEFVAQVDALRAEILERAIGLLSERVAAAAIQIGELAQGAESESVRLQAARAVIKDLMSVSTFTTLERRMAKIERRIADDRSAGPGASPHAY